MCIYKFAYIYAYTYARTSVTMDILQKIMNNIDYGNLGPIFETMTNMPSNNLSINVFLPCLSSGAELPKERQVFHKQPKAELVQSDPAIRDDGSARQRRTGRLER